MKIKFFVFLFFIFFVPSLAASETVTIRNIPQADICFSPQGDCTEAIIHVLNHARTEILVQAYSFTSAPIAQALVKAHGRGVKIQVILDKSQKSERYTSASFLLNAEIPTFIDAAHAIAHNKIMIIDQEIIITGSFNFTKAAEERNAENLLILRSHEMAKQYTNNWYKHLEHSKSIEDLNDRNASIRSGFNQTMIKRSSY
jgi:phosphatidylserine/phosphatidylglycerophosphate/cardiolipin synthase-like enzyme